MTAQEAVCERIDELCKKQGISLYTLAKRAAIATSTVDNIINNGVDPSQSTICKISSGFGLSMRDFYQDEKFAICEEK